jgi:DNA-binding CsgD family transcriptional regulator
MSTPGGHLDRGRDSYRRRAWADAYEAFALADADAALAAEDLERLALAAGLTGREEDSLRLMERLYQTRLDAGEGRLAARTAFWMAMRLHAMGEPARAGGWLTRAQRLVEREVHPCVEEGYLLLMAIRRQIATGELEAAQAGTARAVAIAERFGEVDLLALARHLQGRVTLQQGRLEEGLSLLDEVMVAAAAGELSPTVTGVIYCAAIGTLQQVYALDRAREWTTALATWCEAQPQLVTFTGACLVHRSEILQLGGAWGEAIDEARRVCEKLTARADAQNTASAFYQQAEIHRLRGELAEAEEAYRRASQLGLEPQPGLALLRLAQGDREAATSGIRRVVAATADPLLRSRFLPACVEILLAVGDVEQARAACAQLEEAAAGFKAEVLGALAAHARGAVELAAGSPQSALEPARSAFTVWQRIGAPYIAARLRVLLGRACRALGDEDGARLELAAAREVFQGLGAGPDLALVDALLAPASQPPRASGRGLTARELQVLRLIASGKTNKAIARELELSEKTVDRHVSNIFNKIDVSTRAAATAYAYEHDLV